MSEEARDQWADYIAKELREHRTRNPDDQRDDAAVIAEIVEGLHQAGLAGKFPNGIYALPEFSDPTSTEYRPTYFKP